MLICMVSPTTTWPPAKYLPFLGLWTKPPKQIFAVPSSVKLPGDETGVQSEERPFFLGGGGTLGRRSKSLEPRSTHPFFVLRLVKIRL